jgi:hypothetical protein
MRRMQAPRALIVLPFLAALLAGLSSTGCRRMREKAEEEAIERATGGKVHIDTAGQGVTVASPDGGASVAWGASAKVPDDFPKNVPIYPGASIKGSVSTNDRGKSGFVLTMDCSDTPDPVVTYYKTQLGSSMKSTMDMSSGLGHMMTFQDEANKQVVNVVINGDERTHRTTISLQVGRE